jgi:hypothetical protein
MESFNYHDAKIFHRYFQCTLPMLIAQLNMASTEDEWNALIASEHMLERGNIAAHISFQATAPNQRPAIFVGICLLDTDSSYDHTRHNDTHKMIYGWVPYKDYRECDLYALIKHQAGAVKCKLCKSRMSCLDSNFCVECYPYVYHRDEPCGSCDESGEDMWIKLSCEHMYHRQCYEQLNIDGAVTCAVCFEGDMYVFY